MKAMSVVVLVFVACGGGTRELPPPAGPEPADVVEAELPRPERPEDAPFPAEIGAVWGERVEKAFVTLTVDSLVPAPARATAEAAWVSLDGAPGDLPADDAALGAALRRHAAVQIGSKELPPERAWTAIEAMTGVADNVHALLFDAGEMTQLGEAVMGKPFVSPGLMVHWTPDGELAIAEILPGAPAAAAGLVVGDVITSIDGRPPRRVGAIFAGTFVAPGTQRVLGIQRGGIDSKVTLTLEPYLHPVATHRVLKGGVGHLRLYFCGAGESEDRHQVALTRAALAEFDKKKVSRIVIDMRGNMGGLGVSAMASIFTTADPILFARARGDTADEPWARKGDAWPRARPIAVLVDEQTISCGEMIAYALAEHGVARLFGQPTGDALHVPDQVDLGEGYMLWVPRSAVFGPTSKAAPAGHRVTPHEVVPNRTVGELMAGKDPQLDAALAWLAKQKAPKR
jgi:C-terminal processing protease CtpA/Prc